MEVPWSWAGAGRGGGKRLCWLVGENLAPQDPSLRTPRERLWRGHPAGDGRGATLGRVDTFLIWSAYVTPYATRLSQSFIILRE